MANAEEPLSPEAELLVLLSKEAAVQAQLASTPLFEEVKRRELNEQLNILRPTITLHCARHGLARPT
jgi:hypothetical protein